MDPDCLIAIRQDYFYMRVDFIHYDITHYYYLCDAIRNVPQKYMESQGVSFNI